MGLPCREEREVRPCREASEEQGGDREEQEVHPCREAWGAPGAIRVGQEEQAGDRGVRVGWFRRSCFFLLKSRKAATFALLMST